MRQATYKPACFSRLFTRLDLSLLVGLIMSVAIGGFANFGIACNEVRSDVVRLHILANSDTEFDQQLKLEVRDRILADMGTVFGQAENKREAQNIAAENLEQIEQIAYEVLLENGIDEPVRATLCNMYFTTREYDNFSLPAGQYDAVRVTIGEGKGKNWWCVMYPPMCVPAAIEDNAAKEEVLEIEQLNNEPLFKPKLAIVEFFSSAKDDSPKITEPAATT